METNNTFNTLNVLNVNEKVEKKNGLSYLSWTYAWSEIMKRYPDANYDILPYTYDEKLGYMCWTQVTIEGITRKMWLPVMDANNKAMKDHPYEYQTRNGRRTVESATMFDINKTIMRCLVKNLAMFGLGLYIYSGEDLPETEETNNAPQKEQTTVKTAKKQVYDRSKDSNKPQTKEQNDFLNTLGLETVAKMLRYYQVGGIKELTYDMVEDCKRILEMGKKNA